jgi:guanosine-3',5'-bis(diphosphate) 3'-pyrophosphohydrolase
MSLSSRTKFLLQNLKVLGYNQALKAAHLIINEMSIENGFARHDGTNYYHHLVDVAQTLLNFGVRKEEIIIAALLHDYVEDVEGVTVKFVETMFNREVSKMVELLTKKRGVDYKDEKNMEDYLNQIFTSEGASLVKVADRLHNFSNMRESTSLAHKERQVTETEKFYIPFFKRCRNEFVEYSHFFFHAKTVIEPIMYEMKENIKLYKLINKN